MPRLNVERLTVGTDWVSGNGAGARRGSHTPYGTGSDPVSKPFGDRVVSVEQKHRKTKWRARDPRGCRPPHAVLNEFQPSGRRDDCGGAKIISCVVAQHLPPFS